MVLRALKQKHASGIVGAPHRRVDLEMFTSRIRSVSPTIQVPNSSMTSLGPSISSDNFHKDFQSFVDLLWLLVGKPTKQKQYVWAGFAQLNGFEAHIQ